MLDLFIYWIPKGEGGGAEFDVNLRWLNIHLSLADATKKGRGPRDAVPVHETEGNTRGHPGCLSRVSDIDTQCCDPSRYLVRWFLKSVPWTPTICWPCAATRLRSWWVILIELHARYRVQWIRLFFCESANGFGFTVEQRRWRLTWDRITCDFNDMAKYFFFYFLSFDIFLETETVECSPSFPNIGNTVAISLMGLVTDKCSSTIIWNFTII